MPSAIWNEEGVKMDPASPVLKEANRFLKSRLNRLMQNGGRGIGTEYDSLRSTGNSASSSESCLRKNSTKNRYLNIVPFDFNRVRIAGDGDYINASSVESPPSEIPGWSFIATQGPLRSTVEDFWRMIFEQRCSSVVMLTRIVEKLQEKCAPYYPSKKGETHAFGNFQVTAMDVSDISTDITVRSFKVTELTSGVTTHISHYHYHEWPDHGVPEYTRPIRDLINMLEMGEARNGKICVHCSAGVGRTGTFCTIYVVLRRLRFLQHLHDGAEKLEWAVNVPAIVADLRSQRMGMVQTIDQYYFCYQAIIQELDAVLGKQER